MTDISTFKAGESFYLPNGPHRYKITIVSGEAEIRVEREVETGRRPKVQSYKKWKQENEQPDIDDRPIT